ncbi:MAG: hypothetical protein AB7K04_06095 [Pseudorhodoplanes sp.]
MAIRGKIRTNKEAPGGTFVLGRDRFAKISAVEGLKLTPAMKKRIKEFDDAGLTAAERRREIIRAYRKA